MSHSLLWCKHLTVCLHVVRCNHIYGAQWRHTHIYMYTYITYSISSHIICIIIIKSYLIIPSFNYSTPIVEHQSHSSNTIAYLVIIDTYTRISLHALLSLSLVLLVSINNFVYPPSSLVTCSYCALQLRGTSLLFIHYRYIMID